MYTSYNDIQSAMEACLANKEKTPKEKQIKIFDDFVDLIKHETCITIFNILEKLAKKLWESEVYTLSHSESKKTLLDKAIEVRNLQVVQKILNSSNINIEVLNNHLEQLKDQGEDATAIYKAIAAQAQIRKQNDIKSAMRACLTNQEKMPEENKTKIFDYFVDAIDHEMSSYNFSDLEELAKKLWGAEIYTHTHSQSKQTLLDKAIEVKNPDVVQKILNSSSINIEVLNNHLEQLKGKGEDTTTIYKAIAAQQIQIRKQNDLKSPIENLLADQEMTLEDKQTKIFDYFVDAIDHEMSSKNFDALQNLAEQVLERGILYTCSHSTSNQTLLEKAIEVKNLQVVQQIFYYSSINIEVLNDLKQRLRDKGEKASPILTEIEYQIERIWQKHVPTQDNKIGLFTSQDNKIGLFTSQDSKIGLFISQDNEIKQNIVGVIASLTIIALGATVLSYHLSLASSSSLDQAMEHFLLTDMGMGIFVPGIVAGTIVLAIATFMAIKPAIDKSQYREKNESTLR